jgi:glyoxylase-like metal-dependent hydrolase (beta-lactamase superfamily II)
MQHTFQGIDVTFERVGGHTPGSSIAVFHDYRLLFSGDLVFGRLYPTLLFDGNPFELIDTLRAITNMDVDVIVPGHGATCGKPEAKELIEYWECLTAACRDVAASKSGLKDAIDAIVGRCHLRNVPLNDMKHRRNVNTVMDFIRNRENAR